MFTTAKKKITVYTFIIQFLLNMKCFTRFTEVLLTHVSHNGHCVFTRQKLTGRFQQQKQGNIKRLHGLNTQDMTPIVYMADIDVGDAERLHSFSAERTTFVYVSEADTSLAKCLHVSDR